ncbi:hypothetical protein C8K30_102687 [Promicromonospora sp. AC04]|uniref:hypothetical protein n=1 Tax=Promicromonospora sp. AC04 TaxID=2135723 RepID=UPI000D3924E2|nr:hypothetical protein [Promicromonospora sp. AC04]PUB30305.1 hypothetical protein C8K30_102687 [Promicromonospora sp. AC04]
MSIEKLLEEVAQESEARRHDPLPDDAVGTRRSDGVAPKVLSVRLSAQQYDALAAAAAQRDLPVSTMARLAILEGLAQPARSTAEVISASAVASALREVIRPEFLKAG